MTKWEKHKKNLANKHAMEEAILKDGKECFGAALIVISWLIFGVVAH